MKMTRKKASAKPGYREARTAAEQRFWDGYEPDYLAWALVENLDGTSVAALAMGLDPKCVDQIDDQEGETSARFEATKAWFRDLEIETGHTATDLLGISVLADDYGLTVPYGLTEAATFFAADLLGQDAVIKRQDLQIDDLQQLIAKQERKIAQLVMASELSKKKRPSDVSNTEKANAKLILALLYAAMPLAERKAQLTKLKNGDNTKFVSFAVGAVNSMGWTIDDSTVSERVKVAANLYREENL